MLHFHKTTVLVPRSLISSFYYYIESSVQCFVSSNRWKIIAVPFRVVASIVSRLDEFRFSPSVFINPPYQMLSHRENIHFSKPCLLNVRKKKKELIFIDNSRVGTTRFSINNRSKNSCAIVFLSLLLFANARKFFPSPRKILLFRENPIQLDRESSREEKRAFLTNQLKRNA